MVWAPNAKFVNLIGDFNDWHEFDLPMQRIDDTGVWSIVVYNVHEYDAYKYRIVSTHDELRYKADPFMFHSEERPKTASKIYDLEGYSWNDKRWINARSKKELAESAVSIYEVNLSSWAKKENNDNISYMEMADRLVNYVNDMGYTHVEIMPVMEHPFDGSWGYQTTGYFAPTSRFGTPKDFMYLVESFHKKGIGVILDWVPGSFCKDEHGLERFDGSYCYEWNDPNKAQNNKLGTFNFDYSKGEVISFLISSLLYWHDYYHIDGIRINDLANILYFESGQFGGQEFDQEFENKDAINFIKTMNKVAVKNYPYTTLIADEGTDNPPLSKSLTVDGLGFHFRWNSTWKKNIMNYLGLDQVSKTDQHYLLTDAIESIFTENYILPFDHEDVSPMKGSMINKIPGEYEEKFAGLRLLNFYLYLFPGKKLQFMGNEIAQFDEWNEWGSVTWSVLEFDPHKKFQNYIKDFNKLYKREKALFELDSTSEGFSWIEDNNSDEHVISFERIDQNGEPLVCVLNFHSEEKKAYPIGVNEPGIYSVIINSDQQKYGGKTTRNKPYKTKKMNLHNRQFTIHVDIPPTSGLVLKLKRK